MINNLTKELAESLVEMRNFADIGEIPAATYMVKADAVLDRYIDALRTPEPVITRVEVITSIGREYVNWEKGNVVVTSLQDDGRTLKVFVTKNTEETMTQCPGECYDDFWENADGDNEPTINIDELTKGKRYDKDLNKWVEVTTQYRIDYYKRGDLERRWKYCKTMNSAIAKAYKMTQTKNYTVVGIETEHPSLGQD